MLKWTNGDAFIQLMQSNYLGSFDSHKSHRVHVACLYGLDSLDDGFISSKYFPPSMSCMMFANGLDETDHIIVSCTFASNKKVLYQSTSLLTLQLIGGTVLRNEKSHWPLFTSFYGVLDENDSIFKKVSQTAPHNAVYKNYKPQTTPQRFETALYGAVRAKIENNNNNLFANIAAILSHFKGIGVMSDTCSSSRSRLNQANSEQTLRIDLYSASAEDKETVCCFLDFHAIGLPPNKMKYPLTDLLVKGQAAQSESQYRNQVVLERRNIKNSMESDKIMELNITKE
ncbi:hypothetical protein LXL04_035920 [Taraxacum kok-saghyz]